VLRFLVGIGLVALFGCKADEFECKDDGDCDGAEALGRCEPNGWCSFPDDTCPSARRYGTHAGDGLASLCVPLEPDDGSGTMADDGMSASVADDVADDDDDDDDTNADTAASFTESSDTSPDPVCGNDDVEQGEQCDGDDFDESCESLGHDGGELACNSDCTVDESTCTDCGNGMLERGEMCDGSVADQTCADLGWSGGVLACAADCQGIDESGCTNCGNGVIDPGELCDGDGVMQTCAELGFGDGVTECDDDCTIDTDGCGPLTCGVDPTLPLGPCPAVCSSCDETTCIFDCIGNSICSDAAIVCPPGWACRVDCMGSSTCSGVDLECPELYGCDVICMGSSACSDLDVSCSDAGTCTMSCDPDFSSVCEDATLDCGGDACTATCDGAEPTVECGPACMCTNCP
jgi:hypothetical protein